MKVVRCVRRGVHVPTHVGWPVPTLHVAVAALSSNASSNLFVYLHGRRYAFRLYVVPQGGDEIILVRDALDDRMKAEVQ